MAVLTGEIVTGEATATVRALQLRNGSRPYMMLLLSFMISASLVGVALVIAYVARLSQPAGLGLVLAAAVAGYFVYVALCRRIAVRGMRTALNERAISNVFPFRMEVTPAQLIHEFGEVTLLARWPAVTELFQSHGYWIFMVQADARFAPKRHFADVEAERAFVAEALSYMTDAARARSQDAVRFASA